MGKNKKVPKIRFKGFSEDWEQRKLGDMVNESPKIEPEDPSEFELLTVRLHFKGIEPTGENPKPTKGGRPYYIRNKNELIIGRQNFHNGGFGIAGEEVDGLIASNAIQSFDFKGDVHPYFLLMNMQRKDWLAKTEIEVGGTGQKEYSLSVLKNLLINSTYFEEQERVGNFFSNLDKLITLHKHKLDNLQTYKKTMLSKMFPKNDKNVPEFRFKGFTDPWEQRKLDNEVEFYSGLTYSPKDIRDKGTFVLRSSNVKNGEIVDADNVYVNPEAVNSCNVKERDIIVVVRNGSRSLIGKHAQIKRTMEDTVIGAFMTGVRANQPEFINALMDTQNFNKEIEKNLGATINQITNRMFSEMAFMFPEEEEQKKIGTFFTNLDNLITLHQRKLENLQDKKEYFLRHMFI